MGEFENRYDVVVVGAGNAALCAAISAAENQARVLVLEKGPKHKRGGNSFFTDGAIRFAFNGLADIRKVIPKISDGEAAKIVMPAYTEQNYYDDLMRVTSGKSTPELAQQLVSQSLPTIQWMREHGIEFELIYDNQSFLKDGVSHFWGGLPVKTKDKGIGLVRSLNERAEQLGIDVWYDAQATKIHMADEQVSSLQVQTPDGSNVVQTSCIVLACGSFEANKAVRKEKLGEEWAHAIVRGTEYNTGDGISMALEVGAQRYGQLDGCHAIGTDANAPKVGDFQKPGDIFKKHSYPLGLLLNKEGNRFVDEGADFRNYTYAKYGKEILKQPGHIAYQIFDSQVRSMLRKEYDLHEATFYQADTLEALVEQLPVQHERFLETVQSYNKAVQDGEYNPTIKDSKCTSGITPPKTNWALSVSEGPFYAFPVTCGITFSFQGIKADPTGKVLAEGDKPIDGLFAAGEMIGGIFYDNYPGGSGLMSGAVFGKLAGQSAAAYVTERRIPQ